VLEAEAEVLNRVDQLLQLMVELVAVETVTKEVVLTLELLTQEAVVEETNTEVHKVDQEL
tara:strand:- start:85 stop:264 length:180 start_codon:yes stop_codon:yes gene_type:complete